ncbi:AraC family transcriptional regulator [Paenibacillus sp. LHD-117]|uniref:AraC family transcriptional regulator n=1 Tax=Paenibacillus sp. LHD-117 TaxID=3071412 RepID=UPI0027E19391|nr:AraC family transcriptional regulator [Paenibacillus sp. LHD-117]MDQ6420605.1 AraC family transcriptional regulator [Paenibacillus sp. LHD-117]
MLWLSSGYDNSAGMWMIDGATEVANSRKEGVAGLGNRDVTITMVYPIMKTIVQKGFSAETFCAYASFDAGLLKNAEARIPGEELERLMFAAAAFTGDDHFGLHQGDITEYADLGILGYVMMHSRTVADALAAYRRYNDILCSDFTLDCELRDDELSIRMYPQQPGHGRLSRHCSEDMASSLFKLIGKLSNRAIPLKEVAFAHSSSGDTAPYLPVFGKVPLFDERDNVLRLSREVLDYPILYSDARLLDIFESIAQQAKVKLTQEDAAEAPFPERIIGWMRSCLPAYFPTVQQTAETFGMSARTLQHKLKLEGTSFNDLSILIRKELAMGYLKKRDISVGDIAYALHFSEPSAFQSAFKRWTGQTPGQYREHVWQEHSG